MDLKNLREFIRDMNGRFDLVDSNGVDIGGSDILIRNALRWLDDRQPTIHTDANYTTTVPAGLTRLKLKRCKVVDDVWASTSSARFHLDRLTLHQYRHSYASRQGGTPSTSPPFANVDTARSIPTNYALATGEIAPQADKGANDFFGHSSSLDNLVDVGDIIPGDQEDSILLFIYPAPDVQYDISVYGKFRSKELWKDTDKNYWTVEYPEVVAHAANWLLAMRDQNQERSRSAFESLSILLRAIDIQYVEFQSPTRSDELVMEG